MLTELVMQFNGLLQNEAALALLIFGLVTALVSLGIPGVVVPMSVSSGAMLGGSAGMAVVALGALAGSQVLFLVSRGLLKDAARRKIGERLAAFERKVQTWLLLCAGPETGWRPPPLRDERQCGYADERSRLRGGYLAWHAPGCRPLSASRRGVLTKRRDRPPLDQSGKPH